MFSRMVSRAVCEKYLDPWLHRLPFFLVARDTSFVEVTQAERVDVVVDKLDPLGLRSFVCIGE